MQQLFSAVVPEHAHQRVIDFHKSPVRTAEEKTFLNVVEEFAVAALGFPAVGNIF